MSIYFLNLMEGENTCNQTAGWFIGICGIVFQLWMEKRKPKVEEYESGIFECLGIFILLGILIKSVFVKLRNINYNEVKPILIKSIAGLPIIVGMFFGILFKSIIMGFGIIAALYAPVMILFIRKCRAEASPEGYIPIFTWEKWMNKILENNKFILFIPFIQGFFIFVLIVAFTNNTLISLFVFLAGTLGLYILYMKALNVEKPNKAVDSSTYKNMKSDTQPIETITVERDLHCPNCGFALTDDSVFCSECGFRVQTEHIKEYMFCSECGTKLPKNALFCDQCGTKQNG